jgi:hypothetical protein
LIADTFVELADTLVAELGIIDLHLLADAGGRSGHRKDPALEPRRSLFPVAAVVWRSLPRVDRFRFALCDGALASRSRPGDISCGGPAWVKLFRRRRRNEPERLLGARSLPPGGGEGRAGSGRVRGRG